MEQRNENKTELKMIKMSDVQSQTVDWLWYPFIPYGKLTIIQGDPGAVSYTHLDVYKRQVKKKEDMHKMAEANKAFAHYRF